MEICLTLKETHGYSSKTRLMFFSSRAINTYVALCFDEDMEIKSSILFAEYKFPIYS